MRFTVKAKLASAFGVIIALSVVAGGVGAAMDVASFMVGCWKTRRAPAATTDKA